jgi:hypothetical protein
VDVVVPDKILMQMKKTTCLLLGISLLALWSCKQEEEFDGPNLNDIYGDFLITQALQISDDTLDFFNGEVSNLSVSLSKNVNWKLEITGLQSGAKKISTGFDSQINYTWNGTTSTLPMFHIESCAMELTFQNQLDTLRDTLYVSSLRPLEGFVLADFETGLNPGWTPFVQSGANMSFIIQTNNQAAQGSRYYDMGGAVTWDWLIGLLHIPASACGQTTLPLDENAANVYFNTQLYKPASIDNGLVLFQFREDDNGDGVYTEGSEDLFSFQISPSTEGWAQISRRYDQIVTLVNGSEGAPIGNGLHEPNKIFQVSVLFLANPTSGYSQAYLDYMTFTTGSAVNP